MATSSATPRTDAELAQHLDWDPKEFAEALALTQRKRSGRALPTDAEGSLDCPSPPWDLKGDYRVEARYGSLVIQKFDEKSESWHDAPIKPPTPIQRIVKSVEARLRTDFLADDVVKWVFDGVRNAGLAGAVLWAGAVLSVHPRGFGEAQLAGPVMLAGLFLMTFNLLWQMRKLLELRLATWMKGVLGLFILVVLTATISVGFRTRRSDPPNAVQPTANPAPDRQAAPPQQPGVGSTEGGVDGSLHR